MPQSEALPPVGEQGDPREGTCQAVHHELAGALAEGEARPWGLRVALTPSSRVPGVPGREGLEHGSDP